MTADAARKIVLAKHPEAWAYFDDLNAWSILGCNGEFIGNEFDTEDNAWLNAAIKLTHKE